MMGINRTLRDDEKHLSRALRQSRLADSSVERFGFSSESGRGAWSELSQPVVSRLSWSVVSIASFIGDTMIIERTGLCIQTSRHNATSFLTSGSLFPRTDEGKIRDNVKIKVRLPDNKTVTGHIEHDDVYCDYAVVNIEHVAGFHATHLDHEIPFEAYRKVVAVWRCFDSGLLMATSGVELGSPDVSSSKIMLSTCEINTAGIGGPLVDYNGNFVGMNSHRNEQGMTHLIKRVRILKLLRNYGIVSMERKQNIDVTRDGSTIQKSPRPFGRRLINSVEDVFAGCIWSELSEGVASRISRSVVSLASFRGYATFFACTGFVLYCDRYSACILTSASLIRVSGDVHEINTNLRIEVCLRDGFRVIGRLKAHNLMFNLACVEILGHWDLLALKLHPESVQKKEKALQPKSLQTKRNERLPESFVGADMDDVIAVGCLFDRFRIMATRGVKLMNRQSKLDCSELHVASCKITKAGVGGPLIDMDGNLLGINFYHHEETLFLKTYYLCPLLRCMGLGESFKQDKCSHDFSPPSYKEYRWPLPRRNGYKRPLRESESIPSSPLPRRNEIQTAPEEVGTEL